MNSNEHPSLNTKDLENFVVNLTDCINSFYDIINNLLIDSIANSEDDIQINSYYALNS